MFSQVLPYYSGDDFHLSIPYKGLTNQFIEHLNKLSLLKEYIK